MWVTRDGHFLEILLPYVRALTLRTGVPEGELLGEIGRMARTARHIGVLRHRRSGARYPVFSARSGARVRRLITRPQSPPAAPPPRWHYHPRRRYAPGVAWPAYYIIDVDPPIVRAPPEDLLPDDLDPDLPDDPWQEPTEDPDE